MRVNATDMQNNFGKYIKLAETEKIYIEKKGDSDVFLLQKVDKKKMLNDILESLYGSLNDTDLVDKNLDHLRYERISEKHSIL